MVFNDNEKLSFLLKRRCNDENVNIVNSNGETLLHAAIGMNYGLEIVRTLLSTKADINAKDLNGETPLFVAAKRGELAIVKELLDAGADINISQSSALYEAVSGGKDVYLVRLLIEAGADVNYRKGQNNMLHVVCDTETTEELLLRGVEVNAKNNFHETPLYTAIKKEIAIGVVEALVKGGADVSARNMNDETPIFAAVENGDLIAVKTLLSAGSSVNTINVFNETPLYKAVVSGRGEIEDVLLAKGSNLNSRNDDTLLHLAQTLPIVCLLLRYGINVNARNKCGQTPLHLSVWGAYKKRRNRLAIIKELLRYRADVNAIDIKGNTPLHYALVQGQGKLGAIKLLLDNGANINVTNCKDSFPIPFGSPLDFTINTGKMDCAKLLIRMTLLRKNCYDRFEIMSFNSHCPFPGLQDKLIKYFYECVQELIQLKRVIVSNNRNLYEFIMFDSQNNKEKFPSEYKYIDESLLLQYPIYKSIIITKINTCIMKTQRLLTFRHIQIATVKKYRKKLIFLNYDCMEKLSAYLTDETIQNFLEAFDISIDISPTKFKESIIM